MLIQEEAEEVEEVKLLKACSGVVARNQHSGVHGLNEHHTLRMYDRSWSHMIVRCITRVTIKPLLFQQYSILKFYFLFFRMCESENVQK